MLSECTEHKQKGGGKGYGNTTYLGKKIPLHRKVYCTANSVDPYTIKGLVVRHKCDNPRCINPEHLELGTVQDNINDCIERGRARRGVCKGVDNGQSKLTDEQVRFIRDNYVRGSRDFGIPALARRFHVGNSTVFSALKHLNWKGV